MTDGGQYLHDRVCALLRRGAAALSLKPITRTLPLAAISGCLFLAACATGGAGSGGYNDGALPVVASRDERRVVGQFSDVHAIVLSRRLVFALSSGGIAIYDRTFDAWQRPFVLPPSFNGGRITAIAADPVEDAVWFGLGGALFLYRPGNDQLQRTAMSGSPDAIAFESGNVGDVLVHSDREWSRVSRAGAVLRLGPQLPPGARLSTPGSLDDVYRQFPALRNQQLFLMRQQQPNRALPQFAITSGVTSPDRATEVWLGTTNDGLWKIDPTFQQATPLRFGLMEAGVGSVAISANGVWTGPLGTDRLRGGLTSTTDDLQHWQWIDGTISVPLIGVRSFDIALRGSRAWLATSRGVVLVALDGNTDMVAWSSLDGLPSDLVYAVAARENGAWVGTSAGVAFVSDSGAPNAPARAPRTRGIGRRVLDGVPVYALQSVGDTLWIGSNDGLFALPGAAGTLVRSAGDDPALRRPIRALAWSDSLLVVATDNEVLRVAPRGGSAPSRLESIDPRPVGRVSAMAMDDRMVFIAGSEGVISFPRPERSGTTRLLRAGVDLPGPALDLAISRDWVWVATPNGLVRLSRTRDGGLP